MLNSLMVTGHRQLTPLNWKGNPWPYRNNVIQDHHRKIYHAIISWCINHPDFTNFITGMAIGADQLFGRAVLKLRENNSSIKLHATIPFKGSELKWPAHSQRIFWDIINKCNSVTYVCKPPYAAHKMQIRNKYMVDNCRSVLAIWNGSKSGGTYNCITYANCNDKPIYVLNPHTFKIHHL